MSPNLHVDPAALRALALSAEALVPGLRTIGLGPADLGALSGLRGGAALVAEHDRLTAAVARAARELSEFGAALGTAVRAVEASDQEAARSITAAFR